MTTVDEAANVLGALALAVTDTTNDAVAAQTGLPISAAAALSAIHQFLGSPSLQALHRVLGLTPSGAVRLVDRLESDGLVARGPGGDGRSRSVTLTGKGSAVAAKVVQARTASLRECLADLTEGELVTFKALLDRVVGAVVRAKFTDGTAGHRWTCRLCDLAACGRDEGRCPAHNTARMLTATDGPLLS